jgi:DNA polymerase III epsilon subunit-like protein
MINMNFYLDFEATRFSNRIISIGCVAGNGETFSTLVKPGDKKKVDKFITELTGITNEMLVDAPSADEAFCLLNHFMEANHDGEEPKYYVYGNSDADFIRATLKHMEDYEACLTAQAIGGNLIDYAAVVKNFFVAKSDLALRKVYMLIQAEQNVVQRHDALEDAKMLETVVAHLYDKCKPEDKETILAMPSQPRPKSGKKSPALFQKWNKENSSKWEADTCADEDRWCVKCLDKQTQQIKYFDSFNTAALWLIRYSVRNVSPKNDEAVRKIENALKTAIQNNKSRYGCSWEYSPEGAIAVTANN